MYIVENDQHETLRRLMLGIKRTSIFQCGVFIYPSRAQPDNVCVRGLINKVTVSRGI